MLRATRSMSAEQKLIFFTSSSLSLVVELPKQVPFPNCDKMVRIVGSRAFVAQDGSLKEQLRLEARIAETDAGLVKHARNYIHVVRRVARPGNKFRTWGRPAGAQWTEEAERVRKMKALCTCSG